MAIAGFGVVGKNRFQFISDNPTLRVVSVSDVRFEDSDFRATATKLVDEHEVVMHRDFRDVFRDDPDVLFVSLPNHLAAAATILGLEGGCHVFCEKPPGRSVEDIRRVIEVERRNPGLKLKYGFNHRYHGSVEQAKAIIDSGRFGSVLSFRGVYGKSRVVPFSGGWRCKRALSGGGILLDQGIHLLDMLLFLYGDFTEVHSFVSNGFWNHDVEDNAYALLRDESGVVASIHSSATQWQHRFRLEVTLERGALELAGLLTGSKSYGEETLRVIPRRLDSAKGSHKEEVTLYLDDSSWKSEIDEFATLISQDLPVENGKSQDALAVMELVYRIYHADPSWREKYDIPNPIGA
ncbi:Gfo/Idh/MocA family oxidoreductase [Rhodothermus sp. AH-315-K08]|nr:Gfo/Idh/MocA family oxidoreductase [Rhodothermus sp. AH-315-K08]